MIKFSRKIATVMASIAVAIMTNVSVTICSKCEVGYMPSAISQSDNAPICMPTKSFNGCRTIPTSIADHVLVYDLASSIELSDKQVQQEDCNPDDNICCCSSDTRYCKVLQFLVEAADCAGKGDAQIKSCPKERTHLRSHAADEQLECRK